MVILEAQLNKLQDIDMKSTETLKRMGQTTVLIWLSQRCIIN